jgi:uncharacterized zinc-type alcohol dehydrogenase-like protein
MPIQAYAAKAPKSRLEPFTYDPGPLGPREVEVKVTHCGICHSDQAMLDNDWHMTTYPIVPGHEVVGTVAALGSEVRGLTLGQRVGIGWQRGSCGVCEYCRVGHEPFCAQERDTIVAHHGGFADRVRADANFAIPLPEGLDSAEAAPLLCGGTTVFTPLLHYGVTATTRVAVVGIGGLGHLAVQFLAKMGCDVTDISTTHDKDAGGRSFGASHFIATKGTDELQKSTSRFDFILSTVPADLAWNDYLNALRPQGKLVFVGIPEADLKFPAVSLIGQEKSVCGGRTGSPAEMALMLDFAARHGVKAQIEKYKMTDVNAAMDRVRSGKMRYRVVLEV